ncbi:MAG TPA: alpha/beta fold hydrolase [Steroidobacteraceae bacterium]|nr:alpha/beta fold hydrolase [Steroidobacteraceae bacterium]
MAAKRSRQTRETVTDIRSAGIEAANENSPQDGFAPADKEGQPELEHAAATDAAEQILGANPLLGLDREELLVAGKRLLRLMTVNPQVLIEENLAFGRECLDIAMGRSKIAADPRDRRFSHVIWQKSGYYKRLMQGFVAWRDMLNRVLDRADTNTEDRERARFVLQLFTETFAPTNSLLGNPGALQRITETRGKSLLYGLTNFIDDLTNNFGMPRQVDDRKFQVGKNLATTPGAVVYRGEAFELIQYTPQTDLVHKRPLIIVPPQINKFYATDLSTGRSFAEYAVQHGIQTFCISWRNPTAAQRDWNMETYLSACKQAITVAREITGADRVNTMAACAGGFTLATLLGHLKAKGEDSVESATLLVTVLDTEAPTLLGQFASRSGVAATIEKSRRKGVLEGSEMARVFAWLRPNDLVWLFVANNWVMGNRPPAFDILYWNSDTTRLPAEFHADLLRMFMENPLKLPGKIEALGTPIDMSKVDVPAYVVAGITDHITPWQACYQSKNILRGKIDFVLSSSGHIQSIVNPPTNPKAKYFLNTSMPEDAETWLASASEHAGSWWSHWSAWYAQHGAGEVPAPKAVGSATYPAGDPAPGRYVHQR